MKDNQTGPRQIVRYPAVGRQEESEINMERPMPSQAELNALLATAATAAQETGEAAAKMNNLLTMILLTLRYFEKEEIITFAGYPEDVPFSEILDAWQAAAKMLVGNRVEGDDAPPALLEFEKTYKEELTRLRVTVGKQWAAKRLNQFKEDHDDELQHDE